MTRLIGLRRSFANFIGRNHIVQEEGFVSYWLFRIDRVGSVRLQWDCIYPHPDADFHADQDSYSYSDVHSYSHPYAPAH
jgi:hypothetical protein